MQSATDDDIKLSESKAELPSQSEHSATDNVDHVTSTTETSERGERRGGGRGGRRGGGRGGHARGGAQDREVAVSKALSKILRHDAVKEGLVLDGEGFAKVDEVFKWPRLKNLHPTFPEIRSIVATNEKQRFSLKPNPDIMPVPDVSDEEPSHWLIRANQGHSIEIDSASLLVPITLAADNIPPTVIHGGYYASYPQVVSSGGLKPMGRTHIHFTTGIPEDGDEVVSGIRNDAEILYYIDVRKSLEDGAALWWISENGVVLTEGGEAGMVGKEYWKKVVGRRQDVGVLWEDGVEVAELPQSVKGRKVPGGKGPRGKIRDRGGRGHGKGGRGGRMKELDQLGGEAELGI